MPLTPSPPPAPESPTGNKPGLLFIAPAMPASTGNGLAMRAWCFLEAYARTHDIHLVVVALFGAAHVSAEIQGICRQVEVVTPSRLARLLSPPWKAQPSLCRRLPTEAGTVIRSILHQNPCRLIHVQRLYLTPVISGLLGQPDTPPIILDLDDIDSSTFLRLADLHARRGEAGQAAAHRREARRFAHLEQAMIPQMSLALVCHADDGERLAAHYPMVPIQVIANAPPDLSPPTAPPAVQDIDLLLVGTFTYVPNRDGAEWLIREILPRLPAAIRLWLVGPCTEAFHRRMNAVPGVTATNRVDRVEPYYARAKICVVPLRAGGGTRIKILEAFALGVPVVSTTMGAEGLPIRHGEHLLVADHPTDFAAACLDRDGAERARNARRMLLRQSSRSSILDAISSLAIRI